MRLRRASATRFLPAALGLLLLTGCSTFHREWRVASRVPPPANAITGRWEGSWESDVNHHRGRLRGLVSRNEDGTYRVRFHAVFWKVLRYGYTVTLQAEARSGATSFHGSEDLGWLAGGVYEYEGQATPIHFFSTYRNRYDRGTFVLERPVPAGQ